MLFNHRHCTIEACRKVIEGQVFKMLFDWLALVVVFYSIHRALPKVPVALKTLHGEHINTGETEFRRESEVMMGLDHLCIVKLYGICRGETLMMVRKTA